jgi:RecB family endonuclease NucS
MAKNLIESINRASIIKAIESLPQTFSTKDVSENPMVIKSSFHIANERNYHSHIGKYLKNYLLDDNGNVMIVEIEKNKSRGSVWRKLKL